MWKKTTDVAKGEKTKTYGRAIVLSFRRPLRHRTPLKQKICQRTATNGRELIYLRVGRGGDGALDNLKEDVDQGG